MAISATIIPGKVFEEGEAVNITTLNQLGNPTVNIEGAVSALGISSGTITNSHVASDADIAIDKLASGSSGQIVVGNSSGVPTYVTASGDVTVSDAGAVSLNAAQTGITSVGTLGSLATGTLTVGSSTAVSAVDTDISSVSASDDTLASAKSIKTYVDSQVQSKDALSELSGTTDDVTEGSSNLYNQTHTGDVVGSTALTIGNNKVLTQHIFDGNITEAKLATDSVTGDKIADNSINSNHYADGSIDHAHYAPDSIGATQLMANSVGASEIANNCIYADHLTSNSVTAQKIGNNAVVAAHIAANAVGASELAANSVGASEIAANAVGASEIAANAVGTSELANGSVTAAKLATGAALPTGSIMMWYTGSAPSGWLLCNGATISTSYSALRALVGSTTPNLQGRVPVGKGSGTFASLGAAGGAETHALTESQMPKHYHRALSGGNTGTTSIPSGYTQYSSTTTPSSFGGGSPDDYWGINSTTSVGNGAASGSNSHGSSSGSAHANLQPYRVVNFIIKT